MDKRNPSEQDFFRHFNQTKAVYANDKIYVFGTTQNGKQVVEYTSVSNGTPGTSWTTINLPDATDTYSLQHFAKVIFISS